MSILGTNLCALAIAFFTLYLIAPARGQETSWKVEITQVDISRFPEVTVFFKITHRNGQTSPKLRAEDVQLFEDNQAVKILNVLSVGAFPIMTVLLVDCSGSMADRTDDGGTKLDAAKAACRAFIALTRTQDLTSLIQFNTTVAIVKPFGTPSAEIQQSIDVLKAGGKTAWRDAVVEGLYTLARYRGRRSIILLTDGQDNSSSTPISKVIHEARRFQIPVYSIALGESHQIDERELRILANETGGRYLLMPRAEDLAEIYEEMVTAFQKEIGITYMSHRTTPDGTRRAIRLTVKVGRELLSSEAEYLERHFLNIESHLGIFAVWLIMLALCYAAPFLVDWHRRSVLQKACREAFQEETARLTLSADSLPTAELRIQVHLLGLQPSETPRIVTARIDTTLQSNQTGKLLPRPMHLFVLLDLSASMEGKELSDARFAISTLLERMAKWDSFCLIGFSDDAQVVVPPVRVGRARSVIVNRLKNLRTGKKTLLAPALEKIKELLPTSIPAELRRVYCVILSDGKVEDRTKSLMTRQQLLTELEFYALGIGAGYDHEFLAQLCGDKGRVDHLETPHDASEAFQRFVALYGHVITSSTRLCFRASNGATLLRLTALRHGQDLIIGNDQTVFVSDLPVSGVLTYLAEFQVTPKECGPCLLGECMLLFDLPQYGSFGCMTQERICIEITNDPNKANVPNSAVLQVARIIQANRLAERAEEDLLVSNTFSATRKLQLVIQRLEELGEKNMAKELIRLRDTIQAEPNNVDLAIKRVRGTTKRLTE